MDLPPPPSAASRDRALLRLTETDLRCTLSISRDDLAIMLQQADLPEPVREEAERLLTAVLTMTLLLSEHRFMRAREGESAT